MSDHVNTYPGERLGMPRTGPGSIGRLGRRVAALFIDYAAATLITIAFFPPKAPANGLEPNRFLDFDPMIVLAVFAVIQIVFIPTLAGSPGHRIMGLKLVRLDGAWTGIWRPLVRTALLIIVIPAVIFDPDQRGLHDKAAGTVLLRAGGK